MTQYSVFTGFSEISRGYIKTYYQPRVGYRREINCDFEENEGILRATSSYR
jgi:hypothetical protein